MKVFDFTYYRSSYLVIDYSSVYDTNSSVAISTDTLLTLSVTHILSYVKRRQLIVGAA